MLDLNVRLLRSFVELARSRSFTKTAERLHMTQPTLSQQIQRLESQFGFSLFQRSTRSVDLTPEGSELLALAQDIVTQALGFDELVRGLQRSGVLKLHIGSALYAAEFPERNEIIDRFVAEQPEIPVAIHNAPQPELLAALERHKLDVVFILGVGISRAQYDGLSRGRRPGEGVYPVDLRSVVIRRRPVDLLIPHESPLAALSRVNPADLYGHKVAMLASDEAAPVFEPIERLLRDAGAELVYPPDAHMAPSVERYGKRQRIPAISIGWFGQDLTGDCVHRPIEGSDATTELVVVAHPTQAREAVQAFLDIAADVAGVQPRATGGRPA